MVWNQNKPNNCTFSRHWWLVFARHASSPRRNHWSDASSNYTDSYYLRSSSSSGSGERDRAEGALFQPGTLCLLAVNGAASCFGKSINHPNNSQQGNWCHQRVWTFWTRTSALNVLPLSRSGIKKTARIPRHVYKLFYNLMQLPRSSETGGNVAAAGRWSLGDSHVNVSQLQMKRGKKKSASRLFDFGVFTNRLAVMLKSVSNSDGAPLRRKTILDMQGHPGTSQLWPKMSEADEISRKWNFYNLSNISWPRREQNITSPQCSSIKPRHLRLLKGFQETKKTKQPTVQARTNESTSALHQTLSGLLHIMGCGPDLLGLFCDGDQRHNQRKAEMGWARWKHEKPRTSAGQVEKSQEMVGCWWWWGSTWLTNKWRLESRVAHRKTSGQWGGLCGTLSSGLGSPEAWLGGPGSRRQKKQNPRPSQEAISRITGPKHCWPGRLLARPKTPGLFFPPAT